MKQLNVRDETHKLGRELSLKTGKSLLDVVKEALEQYEQSLRVVDEDDIVNKYLNETASVIVERLCMVLPEVLREEVPKVVEATVRELRRLQEELREQQAKELERLLLEAEAEDDLPVVSYQEAYEPEADSVEAD